MKYDLFAIYTLTQTFRKMAPSMQIYHLQYTILATGRAVHNICKENWLHGVIFKICFFKKATLDISEGHLLLTAVLESVATRIWAPLEKLEPTTFVTPGGPTRVEKQTHRDPRFPYH